MRDCCYYRLAPIADSPIHYLSFIRLAKYTESTDPELSAQIGWQSEVMFDEKVK
jgi:hypothetical protein